MTTPEHATSVHKAPGRTTEVQAGCKDTHTTVTELLTYSLTLAWVLSWWRQQQEGDSVPQHFWQLAVQLQLDV